MGLCQMHTNAVMILSFRTNRSGQTMQTQIRLLIEEQSAQGLHCLLFQSHLFLTKYPKFDSKLPETIFSKARLTYIIENKKKY